MHLDEFDIQHSIICVPETLQDLINLAKRLLETYQHDFLYDLDDAPELVSEINRSLDDTHKRIKNVLDVTIELESTFRAKISSFVGSSERELEPLVLSLKRHLTDSLNSLINTHNRPSNPSDSPLETSIRPQQNTFSLHSVRAEIGDYLATLLSEIRTCRMLIHTISIREHSIEPFHAGPGDTTDILLDTYIAEDIIRNARQAVLSLEEEELALASEHEVNSALAQTPNTALSSEAELIRKARDILDNLEFQAQPLRLGQGAWLTAELAFILFKLEAYDEALAMSEWTVYLFDQLYSVGGSMYTPYGVLARQNYAKYALRESVRRDRAENMLNCLDLSWLNQCKGDLNEFRHQLGRSLNICAAITQWHGVNLDAFDAQTAEAVKVLRSLVQEVQRYPEGIAPPSNNEDATQGLQLSASQPSQVLFDYAHALHQRALFYTISQNWNLVVELEKEALGHISKLCASYPDCCLDLCYNIYNQLSQEGVSNFISKEEHLMYQERATAYSNRLQLQLGAYPFTFYADLRQYASTLEQSGQKDAALATRMQLAQFATATFVHTDFASNAHHDLAQSYSGLGYLEASLHHRKISIQYHRQHVHKVFTHFEACEQLDAIDGLYSSARFQESIALSLELTHQCRTANASDYLYQSYTADGLALTARSLTAIEDYDSALIHAREALAIFTTLAQRSDLDKHTIGAMVHFLDILMGVTYNSFDPISLEVSRESIECLRNIDTRYPGKAVLHHLAACYTHTLKFFRHSEDDTAIQFAEDSLPWFEAQNLGADSPMIAASYLRVLRTLADLYDSKGRTVKAAEYCEKALQVSRRHAFAPDATYIGCSGKLIALGRLEGGLAVSEESLKSARARSYLGDIDPSRELSGYAHALSVNGRFDEAVVVAREAVRAAEVFKPQINNKSSDAPMSIATVYRTLADILIDVGEPAEALIHAQKSVAIMCDIKAGRGYRIAWRFAEGRYRWAYLSLGLCLMASGNLEKALQLFEDEVPPPSGPDVVFRKSYSLVLILSGWCLCALGRHEEAVRKYTDLTKLQEDLDPEFSLVTQRFLARQSRRPSQVAIWRNLNLGCGHYIV